MKCTCGADKDICVDCMQDEIAKLKEENENLKGEVYKAVKNWHDAEQERDRYKKADHLLRELEHTISCIHLNMGGKHRYALSHKSNAIITEIKLYLSEAMEE